MEKQGIAMSLPRDVPDSFRFLRPWIHKGWEMVLIAAELHPGRPLFAEGGARDFAKDYSLRCNEALQFWNWNSDQLQIELEDVRRQAVSCDQANWLALHRPFSKVLSRLKTLNEEGIELVILTTKGTEFTSALLNFLELQPSLVYGHEAGSKAEVLKRLITERPILGFLEDRLATLKTIKRIPELASIPCYLASWGYLKPEDSQSLPRNIHLLKTEKLTAPLASWH